jgi:hypothetical protein
MAADGPVVDTIVFCGPSGVRDFSVMRVLFTIVLNNP